MTRYIDPNSGAAPQPGGMAVGGAESQRGDEDLIQRLTEAQTETPPASDQEAEVQRQADVTLKQADAKQGTEEATAPDEAKRRDVKAEPEGE